MTPGEMQLNYELQKLREAQKVVPSVAVQAAMLALQIIARAKQ